METQNHSHKHNSKHVDHKALSKKLQSEIDVLLTNIDEKMLFAEFREDEMFNIQNGDKTEVVHQTLDDRILIRPNRETRIERFDRHTTLVVKKVGAIGRIVNYFFKPLHY